MAVNETLPIEGQAAGCDDGVDVRVVEQLASPSVQHECGAERRAQIGLPEFEQSTPHGVKHRVVDGSLSEGCQRAKLRGQGEDDVKVLHVQHAQSLLLNPLLLGQTLTFRTVPVAARVEDGFLVVATGTLLEVTTESLGTTLTNVGQHAALQRADPLGCLEIVSMSSNDVRYVEVSGPPRGRHDALPGLLRKQVEGTWRLSHDLACDTRVTRGRAQACVTQ